MTAKDDIRLQHYRLKKRQEEENQRYQEDMKRKMDMLLKLKTDIHNNRVGNFIVYIYIKVG